MTSPSRPEQDEAVRLLDNLTDAVRIILINEVPSDEAWRDLNDAYDAAVAHVATPPPVPAALDVERLDANQLQHAWMILTALHLPDDTRWEPDRYNCAAFLKAWMAEYARLTTPEASDAPE